MFRYRKRFSILLTLLMIHSTKAENKSTHHNTCGGNSLPYPFGFSEGSQIQLNCSSDQMQIREFLVQNLTSSSISIHLPAKCNRTLQSIEPLFTTNYAPIVNNSLLVQNCTSALGGCVIPTSSFMSNQIQLDGCDNRSDNISCFTRGPGLAAFDVLRFEDVIQTGCKFLFSSIAVDQRKEEDPEVSLQFQTLELAWWLEGQCQCSPNATCTNVNVAPGKFGFRCHCLEGYHGDGFLNGTGCRGSVSNCNASTLSSGGCGTAAKVGFLAGGIIAGALIMAILCLLGYYVRRRSYCLKKQMTVKRLLREAAGNSSVPFYPYREIERATNFFSEKQRLGTGAFGTVYAGKLHNDDFVAIKKIRQRDPDSVDQVMNEIKLLSSVSHPNLVRLLGCCIEDGEQILVYEFMPNGTLSQHLQRENGKGLPWTIRLTIATETANAISYLHSAIDPPIYHRDIKSSNILLDYNFNSKVADFGLSRLGMTEISHISTAPQGTPGYVDPQYHQNYHLSDKSDVYSFGVVLIEIITALKVVDFGRPHNEVNLAALAVDRIRRGCVDEIIDPFLEPHRDAWTLYSVHKVAELAFRCLAFHSDMRPTMMEVAEELDHIRRSGWVTIDETLCVASSVGSVRSSLADKSEKPLSDVQINEERVESERLIVAERAEVRDSSPVSVHDPWSSGHSSPSSNSLLGNVAQ
ncbi:wall-associated receptor kinase-like 14 [Prosopis cineraria]|uniref:wall-associated receptor kinase-like 14 n=1 Tax=Prosopis cineraria TaxID=364024 RepID=UPI0024107FF3|nr:wall-associated receptor kinase-like 14 [Prosopis cineraria]XP_054825788.1 wall-associated receptor kinase-like 14 [Prosopis cineraria]XP_054825789.1 wall-associated receptor kinase-like 14 [Prosopis cineraria]XP_054825791.1 wall-associated receptor kinase-like 14 [Prosopis cineraria]